MDESTIISWVKLNAEPLPSDIEGTCYRAAAKLIDGTPLPCVLFAPSEQRVQLALRRFEQSRTSGITDPNNIVPGFYPRIVSGFVCGGNQVNHYDIASLEKSPHAIPLARLREIQGETSMSWTAFAAVMDDGKEFSFGTSFLMEFFSMPPGYTANQIQKIIPHRNVEKPIYRERPFFKCFLENLH